MKIVRGGLDHPKVLALLQAHLDGMHETSPAEHVHALDVSGLQTADISFWSLRESDTVLGCGALKELSPARGEIKSMRTHADHLRTSKKSIKAKHWNTYRISVSFKSTL